MNDMARHGEACKIKEPHDHHVWRTDAAYGSKEFAEYWCPGISKPYPPDDELIASIARLEQRQSSEKRVAQVAVKGALWSVRSALMADGTQIGPALKAVLKELDVLAEEGDT